MADEGRAMSIGLEIHNDLHDSIVTITVILGTFTIPNFSHNFIQKKPELSQISPKKKK